MVLLTVIGFTACDTEPLDPNLLNDNGGDNGSATPAAFEVTFSGSTFKANTAVAVLSDGLIGIVGTKSNGQSVDILVEGTTTGTYSDALMNYTPTATSEEFYQNVDPTIADENEGFTGSVTITSINTKTKTISGTFNFIGYWSDSDANLPSVPFTNGSFTNIPYTGSFGDVDPGTGAEDYIKASIDGKATNFDIVSSADTGILSLNGGMVSDDTRIVVSVDTNIQKGTYAIGSSAFDGPAGQYFIGDDKYTSTSGSITIISNEGGIIKGSFSFDASNADDKIIKITAGEFNVDYN